MQPIWGLWLKDTSDSDLAQLGHWPELRRLDIFSDKITDSGLINLKELEGLQQLYLATRITNAGLVHLSGLTELRELNLVFFNFTEGGLTPLKELKKLRTLYLWEVKVPESELKDLRKALPNLEIVKYKLG